MQGSERRHYARHPIRVPITVRPPGGQPELRTTVGDLSEAGLCFSCPTPYEAGSAVEVTLPVGDTSFTLAGTVTRSTASEEGSFTVGVAFLHPAMSFRMKLAEQVLRIRELRLELSRARGEEISNEEAARHWVESYAAEFADLYG